VPRAISGTVIGLYYLSFFAANKIVGSVGQLYSTLPTTTFWLLHVASAAVGLVAFVAFKLLIGRRFAGAPTRAAA
jgi:proton-dependent oligopeptide transporter, POT family